MTSLEKPSLDELMHYGVLGMKWGIRRAEDTGIHRIQAQTAIQADAGINSATVSAGRDVAKLMGERYGLRIDSIKTIPPGKERDSGTLAYVARTEGSNKTTTTINVVPKDLGPTLKKNEDSGFFAQGCGHQHSLLTHEAGHMLFHADEKVKKGYFGEKTVGGEIKARDKALRAAFKAAQQDGIRSDLLPSNVSGYARWANSREEVEAEMFTQYHWGSKPPRFIKVWGETLHREMRVDPTPFKEVN